MSVDNIKVNLKKKTELFLWPEDKDIISNTRANGTDLASGFSSVLCTYSTSILIDVLVEEESIDSHDELQEKGFALFYFPYSRFDKDIIFSDKVEENLNNNKFGQYQK